MVFGSGDCLWCFVLGLLDEFVGCYAGVTLVSLGGVR